MHSGVAPESVIIESSELMGLQGDESPPVGFDGVGVVVLQKLKYFYCVIKYFYCDDSIVIIWHLLIGLHPQSYANDAFKRALRSKRSAIEFVCLSITRVYCA